MIVSCDGPITHAKDDTVHFVIAWAVTLSRWPRLLHPSFISQIEGDVKERTLMFEKTRSFPGDVVYLSRIIHIMGCGWVTESS